MKGQVQVRISPTGETEISVNGVKGEACKDLTRSLENALGVVVEDTETPEMMEVPIHAENLDLA